MPSMLARLFGAVLRTTGIYRRQYSAGPGFEKRIADSRERQFLPTAAMRARLDIDCRDFEERSIWKIAPKDRTPAAHMLYFHGGGYVYPAVDGHWKYFTHMADKHGMEITAPFYPLAPEAGAEETVAWAMAAYRDFIANHDGTFILGGDSAGGGLAAAVAQLARDGGLRQADGLILICPWLDITVSHHEQIRIEPRDCILTIAGGQMAGRMYARDIALDDPRVSPIHGSWTGLPPVLAFGGGDDILLTDARALAAKLPTADYVEGDGLMHDWPLFFFAESRRAQAKMAEFAMHHAAQ
jgi:monoterpene epsilon-lactone hydrolase